MTKIAGWYGKIPSLGDFASRRLSGEFIDSWDAWLQRSIAASRALLGDRWLEIYLTSPIWRFALMPEVIGRNAWAGVLMPSVDSVGRHFPLTLAVEVEPRAGPQAWALVLDAQAWYAQLEEVALAALDVHCAPDDIERALEQIGMPAEARRAEPVEALASGLAEWWRSSTGTTDIPMFRDLDAMRSTLATMAESVFASTAEGRSLWWSQARGVGATELHCQIGLPHEDYFARLLQGTLRAHAQAPEPGNDRLRTTELR